MIAYSSIECCTLTYCSKTKYPKRQYDTVSHGFSDFSTYKPSEALRALKPELRVPLGVSVRVTRRVSIRVTARATIQYSYGPLRLTMRVGVLQGKVKSLSTQTLNPVARSLHQGASEGRGVARCRSADQFRMEGLQILREGFEFLLLGPQECASLRTDLWNPRRRSQSPCWWIFRIRA